MLECKTSSVQPGLSFFTGSAFAASAFAGLPIGLSHSSFQKIRHPASQPSWAAPLQRMFDRCTVLAILRPPMPSAGSQVLCARLPTFTRAPQYFSISGMNGSSSSRPLASSVARISSFDLTWTHSSAWICGECSLHIALSLAKKSSLWAFHRREFRAGTSNQGKLASEERFGVTLRRAALHAPDPRQSPKGLVVEPLLGALATEMRDQQLDLALQRRGRYRHVNVGLADVAVPL